MAQSISDSTPNGSIDLVDKINHLEKRIRIQTWTIGSLAILLFAALLYWLLPHNDRRNLEMWRPGPADEKAAAAIDSFAKEVANTRFAGTKGVLFKIDDIYSYVKGGGAYDDIIDRHGQAEEEPPAGYEWRLAFYWEYDYDSPDTQGQPTKRGLGYYVVPVLYSPVDDKVLDYFDKDNKKYYNHNIPSGQAPNVYNEGHLFP
ncbi:MAG: hypothetical protein EOO15_20290 [Chitinophagaceae bacterium]|nr:MAG: hypothetical protein EOO15_20290 [Chitinophagaceae bacterium]